MTLDEAIAHERRLTSGYENDIQILKNVGADISSIASVTKQKEYHKQLSEWLEDYKRIKQWKSDIMDSFCKYDVSSFEELVANARNKAIDDFVKEICKMIVQSENNGNYRFYAVEIKQAIAELAEQLKVGVNNETDNQ